MVGPLSMAVDDSAGSFLVGAYLALCGVFGSCHHLP